jgi:hypothetical protein
VREVQYSIITAMRCDNIAVVLCNVLSQQYFSNCEVSFLTSHVHRHTVHTTTTCAVSVVQSVVLNMLYCQCGVRLDRECSGTASIVACSLGTLCLRLCIGILLHSHC